MDVSHAEALRKMGFAGNDSGLALEGKDKGGTNNYDRARNIKAIITFIIGLIGVIGFARDELDDIMAAIYSPDFDLWREPLKAQGLEAAFGSILLLFGLRISIFKEGHRKCDT